MVETYVVVVGAGRTRGERRGQAGRSTGWSGDHHRPERVALSGLRDCLDLGEGSRGHHPAMFGAGMINHPAVEQDSLPLSQRDL